MQRVLEAFGQLHERGIAHGDPSPKNVMVETGDRVRIIDFGCSRDLESVLQMSRTQPGGTDGYSPSNRLSGEDKASLWSDLYAASAVAFRLFTDKQYNQVEQTESSYLRQLRASGVPKGVAAIIVKGLHSKDARYGKDQDDPRLFQSATEMAAAIAAWRRWQVRRRQFVTMSVLALIVAAPLVGFGAWSYGKYLELRHVQQQQTVSSLQSEVALLPNSSHPAVKAKLAECDALLAELHRAETAGELAAAREAQSKVIAAMRAAIDTSRGLERFVPLRESLGIVLQKMPWVTAAPTIAQEKMRLDRLYLGLGGELDRGEMESAAQSLTALQRDLAELSTRNVKAASANQARTQFEQDQDGLAERVRKLEGFQPVAALAGSAREAWKSGDFSQALSLFGQAQQKLTAVLPDLEKPEERSEREAKQTTYLREQGVQLRQQVAAVTGERDVQLTRVRELEGKITRITERGEADRKALEDALIREATLKEKNKAGSAVLKDLRKTVDEQELKVKELADIRLKYDSLVKERGIVVDIDMPSGSLPAIWIGRDAGDRVLLKVKGVNVPFRWCPPGKNLKGENVRGFWMLETEVTQELWTAVMKSSPDLKCGKGARHPVYNVSRRECEEFNHKLNSLLEKAGSFAPSWEIRLPTEEQWEYACLAGSTETIHENELGDHAWYEANSGGATHPVGQKKPNKWGLYDMLGSVWEMSKSERLEDLLMRGGSWEDDTTEFSSTSSRRMWYGTEEYYCGFRVALVRTK